MGIRAVSPYSVASGVAVRNRELPSLEPTLIFNTGAPISIEDAMGGRIEVGTGQAFYAGLHHRFCFSLSHGTQSGVHIRMSAEAAWRVLGPGAAACTDRAVALGQVTNHRLMGALARQGPPRPECAADDVCLILAEALKDAGEPDRDALWFLKRLAAPGAKVDRIAGEMSWSRRRLIERCRGLTGVTPKTFARIARFQRLIKPRPDAEGRAWAERALEAGYYDQSHMIREFSEFVGMAPTTYFATGA